MGFQKSADETLVVPRSKVPALMLVGQLDLTTPKFVSDQAARLLENSRTIVFPLTGHWALLNYLECGTDIVLGFFDDPAKAVDLRCVDALPTTRWAAE